MKLSIADGGFYNSDSNHFHLESSFTDGEGERIALLSLIIAPVEPRILYIPHLIPPYISLDYLPAGEKLTSIYF